MQYEKNIAKIDYYIHLQYSSQLYYIILFDVTSFFSQQKR
jgi:hypothetical protein